MSNANTSESTKTERSTLETEYALPSPEPECPAIRIIGVGTTGVGLVIALQPTRTGSNVDFMCAWSAGDAEALSCSEVSKTSHRPGSTDLVVILADASDADALRTSGIIGRTAHAAGAFVLAMFAQPLFPPGAAVKTVTADIADCIDALVFIPLAPNVSMLHHLLNVYIDAFSAGPSGPFCVPVGAEFLDVRGAFADTGEAFTGIGRATGSDRARRAAEMAIADVGHPRLVIANGLLTVVTGASSLRLQEIAAAAYAIHEATAGDAVGALVAHYDDRLGDEVRVTVIAAESGD